jgi:hypothetical protein
MTSRSLWISGLVGAAATALLLLAVYAAYEIVVVHPFTMVSIHSSDHNYFFLSGYTIRRLAFFGAVVAVAAVFCLKGLRKDWPILLVPAAMLVPAGHAGALIAVLVQWTAGLAVGIPIYRRLRGSNMPRDAGLTGIILAWFLGGAVNAYFAWIAFHWPVNYDYTYWSVLLLEIIFLRRPLAEVLAASARKASFARWRPGQWIIALSAIILLPSAMVPHYAYDELVRHLFFPKQVALFGRHAFDPGFIWSMDTEVFAQAHYTIAYLLGGQYAARLSAYIMNFAALLLLEDYARRRFGAAAAVGTALVSVSTPLLSTFVSHVNLESPNLLAAAVGLVVGLDVLKRPQGRSVALFFIVAALGYLYKQQTAFITVPLAAVLVIGLAVRIGTRSSWQPILWLLVGGLAGVALVTPFLLQNYIQTGNPMFPWLNSHFHSPWIEDKDFEGIRFDKVPLGPQSLSELTFNGWKFGEHFQFQFGISYYVLAGFVPLVFFPGGKNRLVVWVILGVFLASVVLWWKVTSPNMRYFCGSMAPGGLLLGLTIQKLWELFRRRRLASVLAGTAAAIVLAVNLASQANGPDCFRPYPLVEMYTKRYDRPSSWIQRQTKFQRIFNIAAAKYGKDAKCLLFDIECLYMADQHIDWINGGLTHPRHTSLGKCRNGEEAFNLIFRQWKYTCVIMMAKSKCPLLNTRAFRDRVEVVDSREGIILVAPH